MQILTAEQIRAWDQFTIKHEPVSSIDLMERAAAKCAEWIEKKQWRAKQFSIFCGKGNNGGDGLAIARMLIQKKYSASVYVLASGNQGTHDFETNLQRLQQLSFAKIKFISEKNQLPQIGANDMVIDALFGTGLNKPLEGFALEVVQHINDSGATVVAIDLPSGLSADQSSPENTVVHADYTLTFQCYKPGLLLQENAPYIGEVHVLDIGLHPKFLEEIPNTSATIDLQQAKEIYKPRSPFAHKGTFGHALIVSGSYGKMGAAVLSTRACVCTGAGLTTAFIPKCGYNIMQIAVPEAMVITDANNANELVISFLPDDVEKYSAIGIGPGIGTNEETQKMFSFIIRRYSKPLVIDADGLNCLALQKDLLQQLPSHSILTPHPKEFERLFGEQKDDWHRIETAKRKAAELNIIIVLKSHHTLIALPDGRLFFNTTGNAGLAKGGSGDVLTGMLTSLIAQGYTPEKAAILGIYLHGLAADCAARKLALESMTASDVISYLSKAFLIVNGQRES